MELPCSAVILNGSKSTDDLAITRWEWIRDGKSLAIGSVVDKTDCSPVLIITDVSVGKYVFNLTVYDEQGLSDTDTVTFVVKNDPKLYYLVEVTINADVKFLSQTQYDTVKAKLALLVQDGMLLQVNMSLNLLTYLQGIIKKLSDVTFRCEVFVLTLERDIQLFLST